MKRIITIFTMLLLFVLPFEVGAKEFPKLTDVPLDKVFTVTFSDSVDINTINRNYINIYEASTNKPLFNLDFSVSEDGKKVFISNKDLYAPDTEYNLEIRNPKSAKGVVLDEITTLKFKTKSSSLPTNSEMKVHYIDVGQGDSSLIQFEDGKTVLIDGGPLGSGEKVVAYLKSLGVNHLDYVIATHPDADHIGGLIDVVNSFTIGTFLDSGKLHTSQTYENLLLAIEKKNVNFKIPEIGEILFHNQVVDSYLQVLYVDSKANDNNDASIVLKAGLGEINFLFMADASKSLEELLVAGYDTMNAQILKAGHHGSDTSSSLKFLQAAKPEAIILSYGKDNAFGHPHQAVLNNINTVNANAYSTSESGNIIATTDGKTYSISAIPMELPPEVTEPKPGDPGSGSYVIPGAPTDFSNCTEMRNYYPNGVKIGHPAYASKHDRDSDGWACER